MDDLDTILKSVSDKYKADVIIYSGAIESEGAEAVVDLTASPTNDNVIFILCTHGGDPNAAFKIARRLQDKYKKFTLYVYGYCKSAGTFIAVGSDQILMGDTAEFGPLDVQLSEEDKIHKFSSGLNINEALVNLRQESKLFFREMLIELTTEAGLSTKMAAEIASNLSIDFFAPIVSQIDPLKVGKIRRALTIAMAYGERLLKEGRGNLKSREALVRLVEGYPDHGFVIDFKEAKSLFKNIKREEADIKELGDSLSEIIKRPTCENVIDKIYPTTEEKLDGAIDQQTDTGGTGKTKTGKGKADDGNSGEGLSAKLSKKAA